MQLIIIERKYSNVDTVKPISLHEATDLVFVDMKKKTWQDAQDHLKTMLSLQDGTQYAALDSDTQDDNGVPVFTIVRIA